MHRGLPELAGRVHLDVRRVGRDRRPLEGLPVQTLVGEHPHGPESEGVWVAELLGVPINQPRQSHNDQ